MLTSWLILILINICFAFVMLYPFYLRDRHPSRYRSIWAKVGNFMMDRHGSVWLIIIMTGGTLFNITSHYLRSLFAYFMVMIAYFIFSGLVLIYPYHLKNRVPERYVGIWKCIGEWMGEPMIALPKRKD